MQSGVLAKLYTGKGSTTLHDSGVLARNLVFLHQPSTKSSADWSCIPDENMMSIYSHRIQENLKFFYTRDQESKKFIITLGGEAQQMLQEFSKYLASFQEPLSGHKAWIAKLAGQTARLAGVLHFFRYGLDALNKQVCADDYRAAQDIATTLIYHNSWLLSPTGLAAKENAEKIVACLSRIPNPTSKQHIINTGLSSSKIVSMTGLRKQEVNNALYLLFYANRAAIFDDGSDNLQARFRPDLFGINLQNPAMLPQNPPMSLF